MKKLLKNRIIRILFWEGIALLGCAMLYLVLYHSPISAGIYQYIPSGETIKKACPFVIIIMVIVDLFVFFPECTKENKYVIYAIALLTLITSLPMFMPGLSLEQDLDYHLIRLETLTDCLRSGQFPVRINAGYFDGYGYPNSIFYGDLLLYVPAFFELIGFPLYQAFKIYVVFINLLSAIFAYIGFKGIFSNKRIGMACTFAYCCAPYRLGWGYVSQFVGLFSAITFLPLVALAVYRIYTGGCEDRKGRVINSAILAVAMSLTICTHLLSTLLCCLGILVVALVLFKKTFKVNVIKTYLLAALETILLSAAFVVPFLDYYFSVPTAIKEKVAGGAVHIQSEGLNLTQIFGIGMDAYGSVSRTVYDNNITFRNMSLGMVIILAVLSYVVILLKKKSGKIDRICFYTGIAFVFASTLYFPWDYLTDNFALAKIVSNVQFPWRMLEVAAVFLTVLLGRVLAIAIDEIENGDLINREILTEKGIKTVTGLLCIICMVISFTETCVYTSSYTDGSYLFFFEDENSLQMDQVISGEYLLSGSSADREYLTHTAVYGGGATGEEAGVQNGCHYEISCSNTSSADGYVDIPMFNYKGYVAKDDVGNRLSISDGDNKVIRVTVPAGFDGRITVDFSEPAYWRLAELVSLISIALLIFFAGRVSRKEA